MKKDIHPDYREVVFQDVSAGTQFVTRSTVRTRDTIEVDGKEYPLVSVSISSASHPFFTGKQKFVDTAGRIEKFQKRFQIDDSEGTAVKIRKAGKTKKQAKREARIAAAKARDEAKIQKGAVKDEKSADEKPAKAEKKEAKADAKADAPKKADTKADAPKKDAAKPDA